MNRCYQCRYWQSEDRELAKKSFGSRGWGICRSPEVDGWPRGQNKPSDTTLVCIGFKQDEEHGGYTQAGFDYDCQEIHNIATFAGFGCVLWRRESGFLNWVKYLLRIG